MSNVHNILSTYPVASYQLAQQNLQKSMAFLSSGTKLLRPGEGPAEFGIAESFQYQIRNTNEAMMGIQNAVSMISTTDSWMQNTQDILNRMSELAISAVDSSKNDGDRENLNLEFQQLKEEIARIASDAKYNKVQIAGRGHILSYDTSARTFLMTQEDGSESYHLPNFIMSGLSASNGIDYLFVSTNPYTMSKDGNYIFYVDANSQLTRYEVETGLITPSGTPAISAVSAIDVDNEGRLWYLTQDTTNNVYHLNLEDIDAWEPNSTVINADAIQNIASLEFKVYNNRITYLNSANSFVSRSLLDATDTKILLEQDAVATPINTTAGKFAMNESGHFIVDELAADVGVLRVTNLHTGLSAQIDLGDSVDITQLRMNADGSQIVYLDGTDNAIRSIDVVPGNQPRIFDASPTTFAANVSGFAGISLDGGTNRSNFRVHTGPNHNQETFVTGADLRLYALGLIDNDISTIEAAQDSITQVAKAIDNVSLQRAKIGAQSSRLNYTFESLDIYQGSISNAESLIRDVDIAEETAKLSVAQLLNQINIDLMARASEIPRMAVRLLST